jgi:CheY-like chemotaxis protein
MPHESGIDLIRLLRRDTRVCHLPVLVLTAYATGENLLECIKAGATGFVVKPPHKKTFRRELEKARRIFVTRQSPRLCSPEEAHLLEEALHGLAML